jgi:hypothetical protein
VRRIFVLLFSLTFLNSFANGDTQAPGTYYNWVTIWLCFFFGLLFTILFRFLNKHSKTIDQRSNPGMPLSGWVMFLGINLLVRFVIQIYFSGMQIIFGVDMDASGTIRRDEISGSLLLNYSSPYLQSQVPVL